MDINFREHYKDEGAKESYIYVFIKFYNSSNLHISTTHTDKAIVHEN